MNRWSKYRNNGKKPSNDSALCYPITLNGTKTEIYIRTYADDFKDVEDVFLQNVYTMPHNLYGKISTILDIGAGTGLSTLYFAKQYPHAKVLAIEGNGEKFELMKKNLSKEIAAKQVLCFHAAITSLAQLDEIATKLGLSNVSLIKTTVPFLPLEYASSNTVKTAMYLLVNNTLPDNVPNMAGWDADGDDKHTVRQKQLVRLKNSAYE